MPKWIGNRFGSVVPIGPGSDAGSAIYSLFDQYYASRQSGWVTPQTGLTATGGVISDYTTSPGDVYRAHIFTSSGALNVTALGDFGDTIDYVIIGGGGGGAANGGSIGYETGGAGAGAFIRQGISSPKTVSVQPYAVVIGSGGNGGPAGPASNRTGNPSTFYGLTAAGGGGGGYGTPSNAGGGSGGGGSYHPGGPNRPGGTGSGDPAPSPVIANGDATDSPNNGWGHDGGNATASPNRGAGGGGAGGAGSPGTSGDADGGLGLKTAIAGPNNDGIGAPGPAAGRWFAGGGGGVIDWSTNGAPPNGEGGGPGGPYSGGGDATGPFAARNGRTGTGGGGGAGAGGGPVEQNIGGHGGSGIVMVRYKIASVATAKATGGAISFYGGKTIHAFTNSGTFATTSNWSAGNVEYVVVAGGGAGGNNLSGGGGAGGFLTGSTPIGAHPVQTSIQIGSGGALSTSPIAYPNRATIYGNSGTPSYFGTPITAYGGGGGGTVDSNNAQPGGSGGGSGGGSTGGPSGAPGNKQTGTSTAAPGQGNAGGNTPRSGSYGAGGGGGAGGAGTANSDGGVGGVGAPVPATFQNPVSILNAHDPSPYKFTIAAGGGGGKNGTGDGGVGGYGGGGDAGDASGASTSPGDNGIQSTGSGGGGAGHSPTGGYGGSGGSGIVLIAYPS